MDKATFLFFLAVFAPSREKMFSREDVKTAGKKCDGKLIYYPVIHS